jgi:AcrR family transcriptional regulator
MNRRVNPEPPTRRERAQATRRRILRAAHELFCDRGYTGTRMTDVAAAAGVAVQTVYFTFHTKAELLQACYERGVLGEDDPLPPPRQPWWAEMMAATSAPETIRQFVAGNASIAARVAVLDDVVRSAAHEPDAVAVRARTEQLRREGYRDVVRHIAERFGLRDGVDVDTATDIALTLAGPAVYRTLMVDYRWPPDKYVDWISRTLAQALLPAAPAERG